MELDSASSTGTFSLNSFNMKLLDLVTEESKKQSEEKAVPGFTVVANAVGKRYDYSKKGFVTKGAKVLKGSKLPLKAHTVTSSEVGSDSMGDLYAIR